MSIQLKKGPNDRIIELGGGDNPHVQPACMGGKDINVDLRMCHNAQGQQTVDFTADFNEPLPILTDEFDGLVSIFSLEHISWRKTRQFLSECLRIIKPGARAIFVTPNTEAQLRWIQTHPNGWDGRDIFDSASCILFGDENYLGNFHASYWSPTIMVQLLQEAGFEQITTQPYGNLATDLATEAVKPPKMVQGGDEKEETKQIISPPIITVPASVLESVKPNAVNHAGLLTEERAKLFDRTYFNGGERVGGFPGFIWDIPSNEILFRKVMERKPESVLELGAARGYVAKRVEDVGIRSLAIDISRHCEMTRVCSYFRRLDLTETPWETEPNIVIDDKGYDLCTSFSFLEHLPEELIPNFAAELDRVSKRGLHGISFTDRTNGFDKTVCTVRSREWWRRVLPKGQEVVDIADLERGEFPPMVQHGDGKVKLNIGSCFTMFHNGWTNLDVLDLGAFAQQNGYRFKRCDIREGLPFDTGSVDLAFMSHALEHFTFRDGLSILRELRRVLNQKHGVLRILVPDAALLNGMYANTPLALAQFDEVNGGCAEQETPAGKLWALLHEGHQSAYDAGTLNLALEDAGFVPEQAQHRRTVFGEAISKQILRESMEMTYGLSLIYEAVSLMG